MSILIKGILMPKSKPIQILIFPDGSVRTPLFALKAADAVEVPTPHGDLIDKKQLYNKMARFVPMAYDSANKCRNMGDNLTEHIWNCIAVERSDFLHDIFDAPTIIEAEE